MLVYAKILPSVTANVVDSDFIKIQPMVTEYYEVTEEGQNLQTVPIIKLSRDKGAD